MGLRILIWSILFGIPVFGMSAVCCAQDTNPLRSFQGVPFPSGPVTAVSIPVSSAPKESGNANAISVGPQSDSSRVVAASADVPTETTFLAPIPETEDAPKDNMGFLRELATALQAERPPLGVLGPTPNNRLDSQLSAAPRDVDPMTATPVGEEEAVPETKESTLKLPSASAFDQAKFRSILKSLALNTGLVLCVGVAFIFIAKQWYQGKKPKPNVVDSTIQIKSTLRLGPKSNLFLVETNGSRLIVASDQNGIKSVVPLTETFSNTLDAMADITDDGSVDREVSAAEESRESSNVQGASELMSGLYSLASVGKRKAPEKKAATSPEKAKNTKSTEDEIRRKMEEALGEHGMKELFLQTMQTRR